MKNFKKQLNQLLHLAKKNNHCKKVSIIRKAFFFSEKAHGRQKRASGEPYIVHPLNTALYLAKFPVDIETIAGALLHDVLEDTPVTRDEIKKEFGDEILSLVEGVTKFDLISLEAKKDIELKTLQKIMVATTNDMRVLLIKLADKAHNIQTLKYLPLKKQKEIANYALEVYAPLAHKLGIHEIKHEIENLCFPIVYPAFYSKFYKKVISRRKEQEKDMVKMIKVLSKAFRKAGKKISFLKQHRSFYSIYKKISGQEKRLEKIYDLSTLILVTNSEEECYSALYILHKNYFPLPGKFKDLIAEALMPTYKSLHTTVMGPKGEPIKVYIRSKKMHRLAEYGIIGTLRDSKKMKEFSSNRLNYWKAINAMKEKEFSSALKSDLLTNMIFTFNKKGKIIELPAESTPIDFAYAQNKNLANCCSKSKVNEKIVPLWHTLEFGDKVEIIPAKKMTVCPDWLDFVKSYKAKGEIIDALKAYPELKNSHNQLKRAEIKLSGIDRIGLLADVTHGISVMGGNILYAKSQAQKNKTKFKIDYIIEIKSPKQLQEIENILKEFPEIKIITIREFNHSR